MSDSRLATLHPAWVASAAALFIFFWASGFVAAKYGFPYAEPFTFLGMRFGIAVVVLVPVCVVWGASWPTDPRHLAHVIVAGLGVQTGYLIGVYYGIYLGLSTGVIALIAGLQPLFTGALAGLVLAERVSRAQWIGLVLGFVGLALVVADKATIGPEIGWGFGFGAFSLLAITAGTLYQKRYCAAMDIRSSVVIQNVVSCLLILLFASMVERMEVAWTGEFLFALLWSAIALSVFAIMLYYFLVRRGAAAKVTSLIYLSPPTTAVMGWLAFGETLSPLALLGMAVALIGVFLAGR